MIENREIIVNDRKFFITVGANEYEQTEYIQLNEEGFYKPTPVLFISRPLSGNETDVSMQFEGLPMEVFMWFLKKVHKNWSLDLSSIIS